MIDVNRTDISKQRLVMSKEARNGEPFSINNNNTYAFLFQKQREFSLANSRTMTL